MTRKDGRGFSIPTKEYYNPVMQNYKDKLEWLTAYLMQTSPIAVKRVINILAVRYGNSPETSRRTIGVIVDGDSFHFHDGIIHKGSEETCNTKPGVESGTDFPETARGTDL